jgi:DNA-binding response OmpR family regulator
MSEPGPIVLVVDDERFFREAICDALRGAGFSCRAEEGAGPALAAAADPAVGVMVLDLGLPEAAGIPLLRRLREERPDLRVVVVATHADQEDVLEALRLDASDYLAKPLHDEELVLAVRRALAAFAREARLASLRQGLRCLATSAASLSEQAAQATGAGERAARLAAEAAAALAELVGASKT